jgi:hypothetical protein
MELEAQYTTSGHTWSYRHSHTLDDLNTRSSHTHGFILYFCRRQLSHNKNWIWFYELKILMSKDKFN